MTTELTGCRAQAYDSCRRGPVALEERRGLISYPDLLHLQVRRDAVSLGRTDEVIRGYVDA